MKFSVRKKKSHFLRKIFFLHQTFSNIFFEIFIIFIISIIFKRFSDVDFRKNLVICSKPTQKRDFMNVQSGNNRFLFFDLKHSINSQKIIKSDLKSSVGIVLGKNIFLFLWFRNVLKKIFSEKNLIFFFTRILIFNVLLRF